MHPLGVYTPWVCSVVPKGAQAGRSAGAISEERRVRWWVQFSEISEERRSYMLALTDVYVL